MPDPGANPLLLPFPRSLTRMEGCSTGPPEPLVAIDATAPLQHAGREAYCLAIRSSGPPRITARTATGATHATRTLAQLGRQYGDRLPCLAIDDAPAFPTRGIMLDVSRDRVPTSSQLRENIRTLGELKFNHLQLYTEHTFAYAGHEDVWRGWDPITPHEIARLAPDCLYHGLALAANQNCFGHLAAWLRHPRYAPLAETHGEWVFENAGTQFPRSGPFSLCPTDPRSIELIEDLLGQLLPCFSSPLVNIGCDETFDVGYGRSAEAVKQRGRAAVYFEFVSKIAAIARRHGKRPMLWADIALSHPEAICSFPEGAIALAWGYEPDTPFGDWCGLLRDAGREAWVCPGTSSWRSITGRTAQRRANLARAARDGLAAGATGYLVTDWGDTGHHQQWPISLYAIAEAAQHAWNPDAPFDPRAAALHAFGEPNTDLGPWLDELGDADELLRAVCGRAGPDGNSTRLRNASALFTDLHTPLNTPWGVQDVAPWAETLERLEALLAGQPRVHSRPLEPELEHTLHVAQLAARRAIARRGGPADWPALAELARGIRRTHRRLWLLRSRPGGLDHSCTHYDRVIADLEARA